MLTRTFAMTLVRIVSVPLIVIAFILPALSVHFAHAQSREVTVAPIVVDDKAKARDILKKTITLTNTTSRKLNLYPVINDVNAQSGPEAFVSAQTGADRQDSLANWIELSRGVIDLTPGETREIPFVIRVNLNALPGTYHADISFYEGSTLMDAQAKSPLAVVTVNTEVQADVKEVMQLNTFMTDNFFFSGDDILFNYQLENIGNQDLQPKGEIRIYDRKGREVASIPVNSEGKKFTPDEVAQLAAAWSGAEGFGKFKAFLNIDYGNSQNGTLQDTVFFWIIPWQQLLAIFVISLVSVIVSALYFHRWLEHRHMQKFALAGAAAGVGSHSISASASREAHLPVPAASAPSVTGSLSPKTEAHEPAPIKKGFFARFRRASKERIATPAHAAVPQETAVPQPAPIVHAPEMSAPASALAPARTNLGAIDLTRTHIAPSEPKRQGHVINLKNGL